MKQFVTNSKTINFATYILLILSLWSFIWSFFDGGILNLRYFTNQSVMIVLITLVVFTTKHRNHHFFKYLGAIALINIFITSTGFHLILRPSNIGFQGHLSHTIIPILFVVFYMLFVKDILKIKEFWIILVYPLLYLLFSIILGPITNFYPYGFLDIDELGLTAVLRFTLIIMVPIYTAIALGLIYIKSKIKASLIR